MALYADSATPCNIKKEITVEDTDFVQVAFVEPGPDIFRIRDDNRVRQMTQEEKEQYYPVSLELLKSIRISEIEGKTQGIYRNGTPAHVQGVPFRFDTQYGQRSAVRWLTLDSVIVRGLMMPEAVAPFFPMEIEALNKEFTYLPNVMEANDFYTELMMTDTTIARAGAHLQAQVNACTTKEELDLIIDTRPDVWPFSVVE